MIPGGKVTSMAGNPSFDVFELPEEHAELRTAIRALCDKEIAPYAAAVDEDARFPQEALDALNASGFNAVHVPEEFGGQGADSVAACIVIEEVARVDASASLIPAVNKLGTMGRSAGLRRSQEAGAARDRRRQDGLLRALRAGGRQRRRVHADPRQSRW